MRLLVDELETSLYQEIQTKHQHMMIGAIRPHLLIFNKTGLGAGTLKMQIQDTRGRVIATSETLNIASLSTLDYAHKYYRFYIDAGLRANTTYRIALVAGGGYSFSESAYVGWCNGWEFRQNANYSPSDGVNAPKDFELWPYRHFRRGVA